MPTRKKRIRVARGVTKSRERIEISPIVATAIIDTARARARALAGALGAEALADPLTAARIESAVALSAHADVMRTRLLAGDQNPWLKDQIARAMTLEGAILGVCPKNHP